jgi:hypothetical protein
MRGLAIVFACAALCACGSTGEDESIQSGEQNAGIETPATTAGVEGQGGDDRINRSPAAHEVDGIPGSQALIEEARRILRASKTTQYSHTTTIDESSGTFELDCSAFVDYALANVLPDAFATLQQATVQRPVAKSYVSFFSSLDDVSVAKAQGRWSRVPSASALVPGDVVAWLLPEGSEPTTNTGHVMIVASAPVAAAGEIQLDVIDASESGHGKADARTAAATTGLGTGRIAILVDGNGAPTGYRWSTESYSLPRTTTVVLAHVD